MRKPRGCRQVIVAHQLSNDKGLFTDVVAIHCCLGEGEGEDLTLASEQHNTHYQITLQYRHSTMNDICKHALIRVNPIHYTVLFTTEYTKLNTSSTRPHSKGPTLQGAHAPRGPRCKGPTLQGAHAARGPCCKGPTLQGAHAPRGPRCKGPTLQGAHAARGPCCKGPVLQGAHVGLSRLSTLH